VPACKFFTDLTVPVPIVPVSSFSPPRGDEDEIDNMDAEPHHSHHLTAAGGGGLYRSGAGGAGGGGPGGPPFDLLAAAGANLPLSHLGREKAGNAEITPLQVDPSVSFDTVGGLDHYIKVGGGVGGWDTCLPIAAVIGGTLLWLPIQLALPCPAPAPALTRMVAPVLVALNLSLLFDCRP
jgi:hypothetical protein